jgi:AcrR family transcriptional regulator
LYKKKIEDFFMPRTADEGLEQRILDAAQRLWRARGDKGLTLRAVARAAGTTTTTVYKRFRNKAQIRFALAERVQKRIAKVLTGSATIEHAYRRYLRFAENHPQEYKLLFGPGWTQVIGKDRPRPSKEWLQNQFAARFGGNPEDHELLFYGIFLLIHGAASLLANAPQSRANLEAEQNCITLCDLLLKNPDIFRNSRNAQPATGIADRRRG